MFKSRGVFYHSSSDINWKKFWLENYWEKIKSIGKKTPRFFQSGCLYFYKLDVQ